LKFGYLGLQTLYDRYFLVDQYAVHANAGRRSSCRNASSCASRWGLALNEGRARSARDRVLQRALDVRFHELDADALQLGHASLAAFVVLSHDGVRRPRTASTRRSRRTRCCRSSPAGLGNDWTNVRAMGSHIKGTNGKSQGVVPFLKVVNDTGRRREPGRQAQGRVCTYLETWHLDIEEFLELRKNTGDDRRRTHDMNTANWIPDLFMKRVIEGGDWTLFSPADTPDLHDKWGREFEKAYTHYESLAASGQIKLHKSIPRSSSGGRCCRCCSRRAIRG
jgi:ribonucleoside-diphosphate reductase alpha chain